jgi:hypothetical protein
MPGMGSSSRALGALVIAAVAMAACADTAQDPVPELPAVVTAAEVECSEGAGLSELLEPECGVLWGTIDAPDSGPVPLGVDHQEQTVDAISAEADAGTGFSFELVRVYERGSRNIGDAVRTRLGELSGDRVLFVSWKVATGTGAWADIAAGVYDDALETFAQTVAASGETIFVSLHHEPEGDQEGDPADYRAMWHHAHAIVEAALTAADGGGDIVWVMNYQGHVSGERLDEVAAYYPGGEYVDWLSYNPYNWSQCRAGAQWRSFQDVASPLYRYFTSDPAFADADGEVKPLLIGETGSNEDPGDAQRKAEWIREMADVLEAGKLPAIKGVVYFNQSQPQFCDRYWYTSDSAAAAYAEASTRPFFNPMTASGAG